MHNIKSFHSTNELSFIIVSNETVVRVSESFADMTKYPIDDLLNKDIVTIFQILKVGPSINYENLNEKADYFLFTKSLEVRFVNIEIVKEINEQIYIITEKLNSRLEDKFPYLYELLSENINGVAIYSVPDLTLLKANQMYLDFFDDPYNTPKNAFSKRAHDIITGFKDSYVEDLWRNTIIKGKSKYIKEFMYDKCIMGITYWDTTLTPLFEEGRVKYLVSNNQEVTERVLNRKKIEEQNERQQLFIDNMTDGLLLFDKNKEYTLLNKAAQDLFYKPKSLKKIGDSLVHTKYFDIEGNILEIDDFAWSRVLRGEKIDQFRIKAERPDKTIYLSMNGKPIYNKEGSIEYVLICIRDISEEAKYGEALKEQKKRLEAIIHSMSEGLELVDNKKMKITLLNQAAKNLFYTFDEKVNVDDFFKYNKYYYGIDGKEIPYENLPAFQVLKGSFENYILTIERPDKKIYASFSGSPIYENDSTIRESIICIRDITEQIMQDRQIKYHQEAALQAEKEKSEALEKVIKMKDEFFSMISHDFKTPLNVISTAIQAMNYICKDDLSDKAKKYIEMIRRNTYRQLRLVNNLLDITRADGGRIKIHRKNIDIVFLTKAITESVHTYASQKGISITFISSFRSRILVIDDEKYERILLNLLSNAIKFTPEGKSIVVSLRSVKGRISVKVKDNGIGIPQDKIDTIFERFGQVDSSLSRQAEGTGIGLSLVKKFVEALGGSISVKSKVGIGSTFSILLPDEKIVEKAEEKEMINLLGNSLIENANVEFSDIYL